MAAVGEKGWVRSVLMYGLLSAIALIMLLPLLWLVSTSFKSPTENIFQFPPQFFPESPTFSNFIKVWKTNPFGTYFFNSTLIAFVTVALNLLLCSLAAYPLARLNFKGPRNLIFTYRLHYSDSFSDCDDSAVHSDRTAGSH